MLRLVAVPWWEDDARVCLGQEPLFILLAPAVVEMEEQKGSRERLSSLLPTRPPARHPSPAQLSISAYTGRAMRGHTHTQPQTNIFTIHEG